MELLTKETLFYNNKLSMDLSHGTCLDQDALCCGDPGAHHDGCRGCKAQRAGAGDHQRADAEEQGEEESAAPGRVPVLWKRVMLACSISPACDMDLEVNAVRHDVKKGRVHQPRPTVTKSCLLSL